jgi:hypothetical protein
MDILERCRGYVDCINLADVKDLGQSNEGISEPAEKLLASQHTLSSMEIPSLFYFKCNSLGRKAHEMQGEMSYFIARPSFPFPLSTLAFKPLLYSFLR